MDPNALLDDGVHKSGPFRYFCVKDASPGADVKFSRPALVLAHNTELADAFGNLLHRPRLSPPPSAMEEFLHL